ncbi:MULTISPECIES: TetR/AcrR family transcriptional regulator [Pseudomonas aeruginosa group]|uniref:TetR/AcrR family transcriptional regulator n=1 Tax=Pseudomonas aeruginosa group TaxID=136841 RepID=UPI00071B1855|nr:MULTISPECIES: TetR/AcrR family transcriptional regulator [Pseudomonas aeruginosa group]KSC52747.1 TetR family transcriptional regulator [Pseudomonas paraeruginosa]KSL20228.1 TetR family transcriptional regulator [Pseudomonas aeruginosa]MBH8717370.1 TetR/AcrR family transcriptional regulator [Pseudomonas aeruginosa]MBI8114853.1 TetR/AcrR family transcriptional regulator [Pseudomonas aeruginosa]OKR41369.1 TetR family transcriptional regulator [Pseudomonas aeruginosa]
MPAASSPSPASKVPTRQRLLDAAVSSLIELGASRTTTLEVQRRSGASRGALLHHFPTHAALLSATIEELVRRNDEAVRQAESTMAGVSDPVERAIRILAAMSLRPAFLAELELWGASRTDADLQAAVRDAERQAWVERERVVDSLFAAVRETPNYDAVKSLSIRFLRGMALSSVLLGNPEYNETLIAQWLWAVRILLRAPGPGGDGRDA